jgi:ketosteroid isomerase-like protein
VDDPLVETTRQLFECFSRRDVAGLIALCDPDIEFLPVTALVAARGEPYRGHEGVSRYLSDVAQVWEELTVEPVEFHRVGDDTVIAVGRVYAWGVGRVIDAPVGWLWRFGPDGRAVYGRVYESRREVLKAGGIDPDTTA